MPTYRRRSPEQGRYASVVYSNIRLPEDRFTRRREDAKEGVCRDTLHLLTLHLLAKGGLCSTASIVLRGKESVS